MAKRQQNEVTDKKKEISMEDAQQILDADKAIRVQNCNREIAMSLRKYQCSIEIQPNMMVTIENRIFKPSIVIKSNE